MNLVKNIDRYCVREQVTTQEFERRCNLAHGLVRKWRLGIQSPTLRTMNRIIEATGIPYEVWTKENGV